MDQGPPTLNDIISACRAKASWTDKYVDEIKQLYKNGIRSVQKIIEILTKRHKR